MAGEVQLNSVTALTESSGSIVLNNVNSATNRTNLGLAIGTNVQSFDADTTKNDAANTFTANQIISITDNTNAALRVTQLGTGNALVVEDSASADSTPFVVDATGTLISGASSSYVFAGSSVAPRIQVQSLGGGDSSINATSWASGVNVQATFILARSEGGSVGSHTVVDDDDNLGRISFQGSDGTAFIEAAKIESFCSGTPGTNDMPGRLVFSTTADGASSPTNRMQITAVGHLGVFATNADVMSLRSNNGANTSNSLYTGFHSCSGLTGGTLSFNVTTDGSVTNGSGNYSQLSDIKLKENIVDANSQWDDLKAVRVRNFNFKSETGQPTHTHIGVIAQEVELVSPGLVIDIPDRDEDGNHLGTVTKSVKNSILYMKAIKALQEAMERIEALETRVQTLENA